MTRWPTTVVRYVWATPISDWTIAIPTMSPTST